MTATPSPCHGTRPPTPVEGLTYNLRVGISPNTVDTVSPMANLTTGVRLIPALGGAGHRLFAYLEDSDPDTTYYWGVQALDTAFAGSAWTAQESFGKWLMLTVEKTGTGDGTVTSNPAGIDCGDSCSEDFPENSDVVLTAAPDSESIFGGWSGACSGTDSCTVNMDQAKNVTVTFNTNDNDGDGVIDVVEDAGPNNGDGNLDGIADCFQNQIATFPDINGDYVTLVTESGSFNTVSTGDSPSPDDMPDGIAFPIGFFSFSIVGLETGPSLEVTLLLYEQTEPLNTYYKYGPTPDAAYDHWYDFLKSTGDLGASITTTSIYASLVTLYLQDGQTGDDDLVANGTIVDLGGPGLSDSSNPSVASGDCGGGGCFLFSMFP